MKFEKIVDILESQGRRKTDRQLAEISLLYYGAILFNRYDYKKKVPSLKSHVNIYAMMFAGSGSGKGHILGLTEEACGLSNYPDQYDKMYKFMTDEVGEVEHDTNIERFLPTSPTVSINGTQEGLYSVAKAISDSRFGSINLAFDEIMDILSSSGELLNMLKLMYDGRVQKKIIKGGKDDKRESDIEDIVANLMMAGSNDDVDSDTAKALQRLAKTGMYRRSFIVDSKSEPERNTKDQLDMDPIKMWLDSVQEKHRLDYSSRMDDYKRTGELSKIFKIDTQALLYIETIDDELMKRSSEDKLNVYKRYDIGSLNSIVNAGYIISYIEGCQEVTVEHLKKAWKLFIQTRETTLDTFKEKQPHEEAFDLLSMKDNLTHSDLMSLDRYGVIPKAKNQWNDTILLVQELCYRQGKVLKKNNGTVVRYTIEDLPRTNLNKMILSISTTDKGKYEIAYEQAIMKWEDLPRLAVSHHRIELDEDGEEVMLGVESFVLSHFDMSNKTDPYGHRQMDSFIQGQNIIGLDFDSGIDTIDSVKEKFEGFKYLLYTTKSHNSKKSEYKDRFRVLIPTSTTFHVNPEQHKQMYDSLQEFFELDIDRACRNVTRMWFTNHSAEVYVNEAEVLFDVQPFVPDTIRSEQLAEKMKNLREVVVTDDDEISRRLQGYLKVMVGTVAVGTLKDYIHRVYMFTYDLTNGDMTIVIRTLNAFQNGANFPRKFLEEHARNHGYEI